MTPIDRTLDRCAAALRQPLDGAPDRRSADAALYLAHVEGSASLRGLAQASGRGPASVHRAVRRVEALRDDPLIDHAFDALGDAARRLLSSDGVFAEDGMRTDTPQEPCAPGPASAYALRVAASALDRLCEPDAFLMVARGADKAGLFSRRNKFRRPIGLLTVDAAAELAARDWVRCVSKTVASSKYAISDAGRAWLRRRRAEEAAETAAMSAADGDARPAGPGPFAAQHMEPGARTVARDGGGTEVVRVNLAESPLGWLASRKGADGAAFLTVEEVEAGERLRSDFEAAHMGPRVTQDWRSFLVPRDGGRAGDGPSVGPTVARERVSAALDHLGSGLADVALRACCYLEGLEATERRMGWSARSGKVVLKIALQRLAAHYGLIRSS